MDLLQNNDDQTLNDKSDMASEDEVEESDFDSESEQEDERDKDDDDNSYTSFFVSSKKCRWRYTYLE